MHQGAELIEINRKSTPQFKEKTKQSTQKASIFNFQYNFTFSRSTFVKNIGQDVQKYQPIIKEIFTRMQKQHSLDVIYKEVVKKVVEENKNGLSGVDIFRYTKCIYRMLLKQTLCFFSYLWKTVSLSIIILQMQKNKHMLILKAISLEPFQLQIYFKFTPHIQQDNFHSNQRDATFNQFPSSLFLQKTKGQSVVKNSQIIKLKEYINKFRTIEVHSKVLVNERGLFYLINKEKEYGEGAFGKVYKGDSIEYINNQLVEKYWAVKQLKRQVRETVIGRIGPDRQFLVLKAMQKVNNPQTNQFGQYIIRFQDELTDCNVRHIFYQFCNFGNLSNFIKSKDYTPLISKKHIFLMARQIIGTMKYVHYDLINTKFDAYIMSSIIKETKDDQLMREEEVMNNRQNACKYTKGIIHRDLKPSNIMVESFQQHSITLKIIDWAFSKKTFTEQKLSTICCGTDHYQAPQFDTKNKPYCAKIDAWSIGIIIFQLVTGRHIFGKASSYKLPDKRRNIKSMLQQLKNEDFLQDKKFTINQIVFWKQLLGGLLEYDPDKRWTTKKALEFVNHKSPVQYSQYDQQVSTKIKELGILKNRYIKLHCAFNEKASQIMMGALKKVDQTIMSLYIKLLDRLMENRYLKKEKDLLQFQQVQQDKKELRALFSPFEQIPSENLNEHFSSYITECEQILNLLKNFNPEISGKMIDLLEEFKKHWEQ